MGHIAAMNVEKYALLVDNEAAVVHDTLHCLPFRDAGYCSSHGTRCRCGALAWRELVDAVVLSHCGSETVPPFSFRLSCQLPDC